MKLSTVSLVGQLLLRQREKRKKPEASEYAGNTLEAGRLFQLWDQLSVLWRKFESSDGKDSRLQLGEEALNELYEGMKSCHLGVEKTVYISRLKERFYWPGHWNDVQQWVGTCEACSARKTAAHRQRAPLQTGESLESAYERVRQTTASAQKQLGLQQE